MSGEAHEGRRRIVVAHDGRPLDARIKVEGGKHSFAHVAACAGLAESAVLEDVPDHLDAQAVRETLGFAFDRVDYDGRLRRLTLTRPAAHAEVILAEDLCSRSRSIYGLLPSLLRRTAALRIKSNPRGCSIGARPDAWYFDVLRAFGVSTTIGTDGMELRWAAPHGADLTFPYPTMMGTVLAIACAAAVPQRTRIRNGSVEPSCFEQLECARALGATVGGELPNVDIVGRRDYPYVAWHLGPDRVQAAAYATAALISRGSVIIEAAQPLRLPRFVEFLNEIGVEVEAEDCRLRAVFPRDQGHLRAVSLDAGSEPLFSSDWLPFAALLLATRSNATSVLTDRVFVDRLQFLDVLHEHGLPQAATFRTMEHGRTVGRAMISGRADVRLFGGTVRATDELRGTVALALAGLAAMGPWTLEDDYQVRRGHTRFVEDLNTLGVHAFVVPT